MRHIHTYFAIFIFALLFFFFFPLLLFPILFPSLWRWVGVLNRWWAHAFFRFSFIPYKIEHRATFSPKEKYIFLPNHFSYLDIPTLGFAPVSAVFVGKNSMEKIPLFGWMYKKLHITVNRENMASRLATLRATVQALKDGKSIILFPEGGMLTKQPPQMIAFKDGAFRAAIETHTPIVPVSLPNNYRILPDKPNACLQAGVVTIIFHEPIDTSRYSLEQLEELKARVRHVIASELPKA